MFIFDMTNLLTLFLVLVVTILFILLSQEVKRAIIAIIPLLGFLILLLVHTVQILTLKQEFSYLFDTLCINMILDFIFLLITFLAYLWADYVEAKTFHKKSIGKGIDWLFKQV